MVLDGVMIKQEKNVYIISSSSFENICSLGISMVGYVYIINEYT